MPLATAAQTPVGTQPGSPTPVAPRLASLGGITPGLILPDLPPLRPALPDPVELSLRLVLKRSDRRVYLYRGDTQVGSYPVAVGKAGWETPLAASQPAAAASAT